MPNNKILSLNDLEKRVHKIKREEKIIGLCHGTFDLLHVGHIKHFEEAKSFCDCLIVTITPDKYINKGPNRPMFEQSLRAEAIAALQCVDFVSVNAWPTAVELLDKLKPSLYIKGQDYVELEKDFTGNIALEKAAIEDQGGKLVFTVSEKFSSSNIILRKFSNLNEHQIKFIDELKELNSLEYFHQLIKKISTLRVSIVGETIIDEYVFCETVGKSGKEPMLVNKINRSEKYLGGVGAIAKICSDLVSEIDLISYVGENYEDLDFIKNELPDNINFSFINKKEAPTIRKTRYLNEYTKTKLIGFYDLDDSPLGLINEKELAKNLSDKIRFNDIVIEVDYGHGFISKDTQNLLKKESKFLAANSQINSFNSKFHDLSLYKNLDLLCINESELYSHYRLREAPIEDIMRRLKSDLKCKYLVITRGSNGSLGIDPSGEVIECPSYVNEVVDRVGAGDAYLATASIALGSGAPLKVSMFLASVLAGKVVSSMGTGQSHSSSKIWKAIEALLK